MDKKDDNKKSLAVRIMCLVLAFLMASSTVLYVLFYIIDYFKA